MKDSKYYIQQRQEGKAVLSWIENFGLHLINDKSERCLTFGEQDHVLVLHIKNKEKEDTINAYYSYFRTSNKGKTRFCINAPFDGIEVTTNKLWELMVEKADWSLSETRRWWECVFPKGQFVDETTLQRVAVKDSSDMKMSEFVSSISAVFEKVIAKLGVDKDKFTKVCIVGHYAMALPVLYALRKMFKDKYVAPYVFTKNVQMKDNPWQQNSHCFLTPKKLCDTIIKSTPQMTIGDVLREKGITFTLPLSKGESGEYGLPTTAVVDNSELKWNELMTENIQPDYMVGNLAFKRVQLSVFADGFQNVYVICDKDSIIAISNTGQKLTPILRPSNKEKKRPATNEEDEIIGNDDCKKEVYVIDTNVFLDCPNILNSIPSNCKIGLTAKIVDEIDDNKTKSDDLKKRAVRAQKNIRQESEKGNRIIFKEPNLKLLNGLNGAKPDNKILALALTLKKEGYEPTILTSDNGLLLNAVLFKVRTLELCEIKNKNNETKRAI